MARKSDPATSLDVSIARRALGLTPGMSGGAYSVGFALLEHFNRKTEQCDPSIARLAAMLGLGEATVKRATKELCEERDLFTKTSHGGLSHRAQYAPNWKKMRAVLTDWESRMSSGSGPENGDVNSSLLSCSTDQNRAVEQLNNEPRTLLNKPYGINPNSDGASGGVETVGDRAAEKQPPPSIEERLKGLWNGEPTANADEPSEVASRKRNVIAEAAATKRWDAAMRRRGTNSYSRFVEWVTPEISDKATEAEMLRRGAGERFIVDRMHAAGMVTSDA
jgi:hypothetical protein